MKQIKLLMRIRRSIGIWFPEYFSKCLFREGPKRKTAAGLKNCIMKTFVVRVVKCRKVRFVGRMTCMGTTKTHTEF
jgi:hypothetical protein